MAVIHTLSLSGRLILDLHDLNNEGTEGNQQMTRMVWVVVKDSNGKPNLRNVNAISGDMFKHIQADHLHKVTLAGNAVDAIGLALSQGARMFDANRINSEADKVPGGFWSNIDKAFQEQFKAKLADRMKKEEAVLKAIADTKQRKKKENEIEKEVKAEVTKELTKSNTDLMDEILKACSVTDMEGTLVTAEVTGANRSLARKSCIEFGWVVGLPEATRTDSYFHVKYDPQGRAESAGAQDNIGQAIFHRPLNSGIYAVVSHAELYRIGRNDISLKYPVNNQSRRVRAKALLESLWYTFVKTSGAQRNTQHPHITSFEGVIAYSTNLAVPAPTASALADDYVAQINGTKEALNKIHPKAVVTVDFKDQKEFGERMAEIIQGLEVPA